VPENVNDAILCPLVQPIRGQLEQVFQDFSDSDLVLSVDIIIHFFCPRVIPITRPLFVMRQRQDPLIVDPPNFPLLVAMDRLCPELITVTSKSIEINPEALYRPESAGTGLVPEVFRLVDRSVLRR